MRPSNSDLAGAELVMVRTFDAPRALVWEAWTNPEHLHCWMGPSDYPARVYETDFRVGGAWRACLQSTEGGADLWQGGVYREIVPNERLVFTFIWDEPHPAHSHNMLVTVALADKGEKTELTFRQQFLPSKAERDGHAYGWGSSFDRLAAHLAKSENQD
ncbi:MAG: SRPBCC domain-containing protein [Amphiplicatus sp.]